MSKAVDINSDGTLIVHTRHYSYTKEVVVVVKGNEPRVFKEEQIGNWVRINHGFNNYCYVCSKCANLNYSGRPAFCPKCGAKMVDTK